MSETQPHLSERGRDPSTPAGSTGCKSFNRGSYNEQLGQRSQGSLQGRRGHLRCFLKKVEDSPTAFHHRRACVKREAGKEDLVST